MPQEATKYIIIGIITGVIVLLFLGTVILSFVFEYRKRHKKNTAEKEQMQAHFSHQLMQSQIETQEETMSLLGKELHDNVGQLLSSTKMLVGITERSLSNPPETLLTANDTLSKAIHELRTLSKSLNKEWLQQFSFIENLTAEAARINSSKTISIHLSHPPRLLLKADEQLILFRIVQEALQNALKHANAKNITIAVEQQLPILHIVVTDDGKGFDMQLQQSGLGITNIKHRTALLGGTVDWMPDAHGTRITIQIPITQTEQP